MSHVKDLRRDLRLLVGRHNKVASSYAQCSPFLRMWRGFRVSNTFLMFTPCFTFCNSLFALAQLTADRRFDGVGKRWKKSEGQCFKSRRSVLGVCMMMNKL